jgi:hypothetical protein
MSTRPVCSEGSIWAKAVSCHSIVTPSSLAIASPTSMSKPGKLVGRRVLEDDRRVVRLRRDDDLAGGLDPVRQGLRLGGERGG